jgi:carbonic anhydrase
MNTIELSKKILTLVVTTPILGSLVVASTPSLAGEESPHWTYGGVNNPTHWGELSEDFTACEVGRNQSPIDIEKSVDSSPAAISFNYNPVPLEIANNGHTVQVNYQPGSTVTIDGETYELLQFHFHTPSEHQIGGEAAPMELHLVHRNDANQLAVAGVMLENGATNPVINTIWQNIPEQQKVNAVEGMTINAANLLPNNKSYFSYEGSLTTPPCSESVMWHILTEPIQVSEAQIAAFERLYPVNARPIQATNGRIIELHRQ